MVTPAWHEGRQQVEGVVREVTTGAYKIIFGYARLTCRALLALDDGRMINTSIPAAIASPSQELIGKRLALTVTVRTVLNGGITAFGDRPVLVRGEVES